MDQEAITLPQLRPYLALVEARIQKNPQNPAWGHLDGHWSTLVEHGRSIIAAHERGQAGDKYERGAAYEVVRIAGMVEPREIVTTALAMFIMLELDPRRFRSDGGFRSQLVRRVRALSPLASGTTYDHRAGKVRRIYKEFPPKAVEVMGQWLADAFGGSGLHLAKLERADEQRRRDERQALNTALLGLE